MPRRPRVIVPGVAHHLTQRGNNRQPVFHSCDDRRFYLELLARHATHYGARGHVLEHVRDPVLDCHWEEYFGRWDYGEWREILSSGISGGECDSVHRATYTGESLGSREFVTALERQAGRWLRVRVRIRLEMRLSPFCD